MNTKWTFLLAILVLSFAVPALAGEVNPVGQYDGSKGYSQCFANFAQDVNGDARPDIVTSNKKGVHIFLQLP